MITREMKLHDIFKEYPQLVEAVIAYDAHFELLKNRALRMAMTRVATVEKAARVAKVDIDKFLLYLNHKIGVEYVPENAPADWASNVGKRETPAYIGTADARILDVREDIRAGSDPFKKIMGALKDSPDGEIVKLINLFEPVPLYHFLDKLGFDHFAEEKAADEWHIWLLKGTPKEAAKTAVSKGAQKPAADAVPLSSLKRLPIDVRLLEPPEPMIKIMDLVRELRDDEYVDVQHRKRPVHLIERLDELGLFYKVYHEDEAGNDVKIIIGRRPIDM